jgi:hypothetical protein
VIVSLIWQEVVCGHETELSCSELTQVPRLLRFTFSENRNSKPITSSYEFQVVCKQNIWICLKERTLVNNLLI